MGFQSVDELEKFSFEDCRILNLSVNEEGVFFEVEALIVKAENSQNANCTDSYSDVTKIRLLGGKIVCGCLEGYKYYNANDVLINEIPDVALTASEISGLPGKVQGAYLISMEKREVKENTLPQAYYVEIELAEEDDGSVSDTYRLEVNFDKAVVNWERYLNRVQR